MADKGGFNANKPEITADYNDFDQRMENLATSLFGKMEDCKMDIGAYGSVKVRYICPN